MRGLDQGLEVQKKFLLEKKNNKRFALLDDLIMSDKFSIPVRYDDTFEGIYDGIPGKSLKPNTTYTSMKAEFNTNKSMIDDQSITYILNSHAFRSEEFITEHDGLHVLFAGCSETFGSAAKIDDIWPKMVYSYLSKKNKMSGYFNIGHPGGSMYTILNNIMLYIEKFGKPDILLLNAPNFERTYEWDSNLKQMVQLSKIVTEETKERYYKQASENLYIYWTIERLCRMLSIKLIWSCWQSVDAFNIEIYGSFKNYISITRVKDFSDFHETNWNNYKDIKDAILRRDNQHHGTMIHRFWADMFIKQLEVM